MLVSAPGVPAGALLASRADKVETGQWARRCLSEGVSPSEFGAPPAETEGSEGTRARRGRQPLARRAAHPKALERKYEQAKNRYAHTAQKHSKEVPATYSAKTEGRGRHIFSLLFLWIRKIFIYMAGLLLIATFTTACSTQATPPVLPNAQSVNHLLIYEKFNGERLTKISYQTEELLSILSQLPGPWNYHASTAPSSSVTLEMIGKHNEKICTIYLSDNWVMLDCGKQKPVFPFAAITSTWPPITSFKDEYKKRFQKILEASKPQIIKGEDSR